MNIEDVKQALEQGEDPTEVGRQFALGQSAGALNDLTDQVQALYIQGEVTRDQYFGVHRGLTEVLEK